MSQYITTIQAELVDGKINLLNHTPQQIADLVATGQVVIIKGGMNKQKLLDLRRELLAWGMRTPIVAQDDFKTNRHRYRVQVAHTLKTPQVMHDFVFNDMHNAEEPIRSLMLSHFEPLRNFYISLTGNDIPWGPQEGPYFHPQVLHYPEGGGFFGSHIHNLLPQKIGVVVSMSQFGIDFEKGATVVEVNGEVADTEGFQDLGDILLFRYDLIHWVSQSNLHQRFSWETEKGRWTMILPLYDPFSGHVITWEDYDKANLSNG